MFFVIVFLILFAKFCFGNFKISLLIAFLIVVIVVLAYENANLCVRCKISGKCSLCRENKLQKNVLCSKVWRQYFFWKVNSSVWVSKITLSKTRETQTQSCFDCVIKLHYLKDKNDLENILEQFKLQSGEVKHLSGDSYGENIKADRFIVTGNVSGLADKSNEFASESTEFNEFKQENLMNFIYFT